MQNHTYLHGRGGFARDRLHPVLRLGRPGDPGSDGPRPEECGPGGWGRRGIRRAAHRGARRGSDQGREEMIHEAS